MNQSDLISSLGTLGTKSEDLDFVSTGSLALDWVVSGRFVGGGLPLSRLAQIHGEASTAKSVFVVNALASAQRRGWYAIYLDAENTISSSFASSLGIDPDKLIYHNPETLEGAFATAEKLVKKIRETDKDTPIYIGLDSLPVLPTLEEIGEDDKIDERYSVKNTAGMRRAVVTGQLIKNFSMLLKKKENKVGMIIVNQLRSTMNMYGPSEKAAAGGRSLMFYLDVDLKTYSSGKNARLMEGDNIVGITGRVENSKNKVALPFRKCEFELLFNKGLSRYAGLIDILVAEGHVTRNGAWYTFTGEDSKKFQKKGFPAMLEKGEVPDSIKQLLGLTDG